MKHIWGIGWNAIFEALGACVCCQCYRWNPVCVCVREREWQREREKVLVLKWISCHDLCLSQSESRSAAQCLTLCDPMDYTVRGIPQIRILEWADFLFSRGTKTQGKRNAEFSQETWFAIGHQHLPVVYFVKWLLSFFEYISKNLMSSKWGNPRTALATQY